MDALGEILARAAARPHNLNVRELAVLVALKDPAERQRAFDAAYALKVRHCGVGVAVRGIVELGNVCAKDCRYCGIRKSNVHVQRYRLSVSDVVRLAEENVRLGYASLVLQGGEIESEAETSRVEEILHRIAPLDLGVTLSLGEQTDEVYRRWWQAGASRYLLRIETTNRELYEHLHVSDGHHRFDRRVACLRAIRACGYQLGTGVMSCLPGQTAEDLARDIVFFGEIDADMIGMGPYIPHPDTPLAAEAPPLPSAERLRVGLNMIAATRLYLHDVNIAATTALQALAEDGREQGIRAGANVIMPNITDIAYRAKYQLYAGKPNLDENAESVRNALDARLAAIGVRILYAQRGDSPHYRLKKA